MQGRTRGCAPFINKSDGSGAPLMRIVHTIAEVRAWRSGLDAGTTVGFTPTMGALHDGHLAHLHSLRQKVDFRVASVFVNPTQFGPGEDFAKYPRDLDGDAAKLRDAGCDLLFYPSSSEIYPEGFGTYVDVKGVSEGYEGAFRPGHFRGVATVVCKLLNIVRPDVASFGLKDAQQVAVIRRMALDLNLGCDLLLVETVREPDGLAMSSRNVYLSPEERRQALTIHQGLLAGKHVFEQGGTVEEAEAVMRRTLSPQFDVDYFDIVDFDTFTPAAGGEGNLLGVFAGRIGGTRLIDNMVFRTA